MDFKVSIIRRAVIDDGIKFARREVSVVFGEPSSLDVGTAGTIAVTNHIAIFVVVGDEFANAVFNGDRAAADIEDNVIAGEVDGAADSAGIDSDNVARLVVIDDVLTVAAVVNERVVAFAAIKFIITGAAFESIITRAGSDSISLRAAVDVVTFRRADNVIGFSVAVNGETVFNSLRVNRDDIGGSSVAGLPIIFVERGGSAFDNHRNGIVNFVTVADFVSDAVKCNVLNGDFAAADCEDNIIAANLSLNRAFSDVDNIFAGFVVDDSIIAITGLVDEDVGACATR